MLSAKKTNMLFFLLAILHSLLRREEDENPLQGVETYDLSIYVCLSNYIYTNNILIMLQYLLVFSLLL